MPTRTGPLLGHSPTAECRSRGIDSRAESTVRSFDGSNPGLLGIRVDFEREPHRSRTVGDEGFRVVTTDGDNDLGRRIERLEAIDEVRQLAAKYALSLDMRDFDALVNLFVDDVGVPGKQRGRQALKRWYADTMRSVPGSFHGINGHIIDIETDSTGRGIVYSRNDLDLGDAWMHELMIYLDEYERRDGRWYFRRRTPLYWVHTDPNVPPLGEAKLRRPGSDQAARGGYHDAFPSWDDFWADAAIGDAPVAPGAAIDHFIHTFRRGQGAPRVNPRGSRPSDS